MFLRFDKRQATIVVSCALLLAASFAAPCYGKKQKFKVTYPDGKIEEYSYDDSTCDLIGWQKKVGLSFSINVIKKYEGSFGFSSDKIRQLDDLQKDFGLQYESLCKDYQMGVYAEMKEVYECRRDNINKALGALRALKIALEPVKDAKTAESIKTNVTEMLDAVLKLVAGGFKDGCVPKHLTLDKDRVELSAAEAQQYITVINRGPYSIAWSTKNNNPQIRLDPAGGGQLNRGQNTRLVVLRDFLNGGGAADLTIWVTDNLKEEESCRILLQPFQARLGSAVDELKGKTGAQAVQVARSSARTLVPLASEAVQDQLTGELLLLSGNDRDAWNVLWELRDTNPSVSRSPGFQLAWGASSFRLGKNELALESFRNASTGGYAPLAAGYTAYTLKSRGESSQAGQYEAYFLSDKKLAQDSWIQRTLHSIFGVLPR